MLKKTVLLISSIVLGFSLTGCINKECPEPEVITKIVYIKKTTPKPQKKPKALPYTMDMVNFNGQDFYFMSIPDGNIMLGNWQAHDNWAQTNYNLLLKDSNQTKE